MTDPDMQELDRLLNETRTARHVVPDDLMARVLADADAVQTAYTQRAAPRRMFWGRLADLFGGWPAISGMAVAGMAGLWIGLAPPAGVEQWAATLMGTATSIDVVPAFDAFGTEVSFDG